jgi:bifunctional DNA-binding transcriptional regulator/antitoxin component of YhaV-PrlF toxin-antitoxin module
MPPMVRIEERELVDGAGRVRVEYGRNTLRVNLRLRETYQINPGDRIEVIINGSTHSIIVESIRMEAPVTGSRGINSRGERFTQIIQPAYQEIEGIIDHIRPVGDPPPSEDQVDPDYDPDLDDWEMSPTAEEFVDRDLEWVDTPDENGGFIVPDEVAREVVDMFGFPVTKEEEPETEIYDCPKCGKQWLGDLGANPICEPCEKQKSIHSRKIKWRRKCSITSMKKK